MNTKLIAVLALILTLLIGVVVGLLSARIFLRPDHPFDGRPPGRFMMNEEFFMRRLEHVIEPTDEQRDSVLVILSAHSDRFIDLHERQFERATLLMDSLMQELESVLTEEQLQRFKEHMEDRHPKRQHRGRFGGR